MNIAFLMADCTCAQNSQEHIFNFKLRFCHLLLSSIIRALWLHFAFPKTFIKSYNDNHVTTMVILTGIIIVFPLP